MQNGGACGCHQLANRDSAVPNRTTPPVSGQVHDGGIGFVRFLGSVPRFPARQLARTGLGCRPRITLLALIATPVVLFYALYVTLAELEEVVVLRVVDRAGQAVA
jgi:hypothetical protein